MEDYVVLPTRSCVRSETCLADRDLNLKKTRDKDPVYVVLCHVEQHPCGETRLGLSGAYGYQSIYNRWEGCV